MKQVEVKIDELKVKVLENRDQHREVFERADEGWKKAALAWFEQQARRAIDGEEFATYFTEPRPEDHTADYNVVPEMLEMEISVTVELSMQEFRQYVRDDWGWKREWAATASNYTEVPR